MIKTFEDFELALKEVTPTRLRRIDPPNSWFQIRVLAQWQFKSIEVEFTYTGETFTQLGSTAQEIYPKLIDTIKRRLHD